MACHAGSVFAAGNWLVDAAGHGERVDDERLMMAVMATSAEAGSDRIPIRVASSAVTIGNISSRRVNRQPARADVATAMDNAVAESFFQLLKRERIRRRVYVDREQAWRDVFDYIEMFYNPIR